MESMAIPVAMRCPDCSKYWVIEVFLNTEDHTWKICSPNLSYCRNCNTLGEFSYCLPVLPRAKIDLPDMRS
jgi:hypothetical protein